MTWCSTVWNSSCFGGVHRCGVRSICRKFGGGMGGQCHLLKINWRQIESPTEPHSRLDAVHVIASVATTALPFVSHPPQDTTCK